MTKIVMENTFLGYILTKRVYCLMVVIIILPTTIRPNNI